MTDGQNLALAPEDGLMLLMGGQGGEKKRKRKEDVVAKKKVVSTLTDGLEKNNGFLKPFSSKYVVFQDGMTAKNDQETHGIARVAFGAFSGKWFFEIEVLSSHASQDSIRIGCTTDQVDLSSALGDSQTGYGYKSNGVLTHNSEKVDMLSSFSSGDVIGCVLDLGQLDVAVGGGAEFFAGSSFCFYKNGVLQEGGFKNLLKGMYYPAVSLSSGAVVRINSGPDFKFTPENATGTAISHLVPIHLRSSVEDGLKQKPRLKKAVVEGSDSQMHYNQCCHHCRAKPRPGLGVLRCSNHPCTRIFCLRCIRKYYSSHGDESALRNVSDSGKWICLCCTNSCVCKACQRVRFRKQENLVGSGKGSQKGSKKEAGQGTWGPPGEVALETYDMEAAFGLATLFSMRNSQKPAPILK